MAFEHDAVIRNCLLWLYQVVWSLRWSWRNRCAWFHSRKLVWPLGFNLVGYYQFPW